MKASPNSKNPPKHVAQWVREVLGLTQLQFSEATGVKLHSLQSIETGRLPLSERHAYRLAKATGIRPAWYLANKLEPVPAPAKLKKHFERAQESGGLDFYPALLFPRMILSRFTYLQMELVKKHGSYAGFRHSGLHDRLGKMNLKLLNTIEDPRERRKFYEAVCAEIKGKDEQVLLSLIAEYRDLLRFIRKKRQESAERRAAGPPKETLSDEEISKRLAENATIWIARRPSLTPEAK